ARDLHSFPTRRSSDLAGFWTQLNEQQLDFFQDPRPLWRLSLPPLTAELELPGASLLDWAGAQRWLKSDAAAEELQALASRHGGRSEEHTSELQSRENL